MLSDDVRIISADILIYLITCCSNAVLHYLSAVSHMLPTHVYSVICLPEILDKAYSV